MYLLPTKDINYLKNKVLLEIGPGQDFGFSLALADMGLKEVILVDPFPIPWNDAYHPSYYRKLIEVLTVDFPSFRFSSIQSVINKKKHDATKLTIYPKSLGEVSEIKDSTIDISVSNACLEHFVNADSAVRELSRITKKGGIGIHQIDMRDHRDFNRPLEYLTFSDRLFQKYLMVNHSVCGNRLRYHEFIEMFENSNFKTVFELEKVIDNAYLDDILKRASRRFQQMTREQVGTLTGKYFIEKIS